MPVPESYKLTSHSTPVSFKKIPGIDKDAEAFRCGYILWSHDI